MVNTHWSSKEQQNDQRKESISCKRVNKLGLCDLAKHRWKEGYVSTLYINMSREIPGWEKSYLILCLHTENLYKTGYKYIQG